MKSFAELIENNITTWQRNEQKKQAVKKKVYREKLYPTFRDIYGKRGENK
jgi:hypothetical protein